jgi:filamentous hemagglutinin family protein
MLFNFMSTNIMKRRHLSTILLIMALPTNAEITLDGTLGRTGPLPGPNYLIGAELGQQHGRNLFHSFRDFNLKSHESATFSGPNNVNNIIGRVTGGNPSNIDGLIRATIPNANLYFLNPDGILFGPNAKLDVQGSFHASTADYLRLQDGGRFEARQPNNSLLTVAPVEAFGFLTDTPAAMTLQQSKLSVSESNTLSLIGGNLRFSNAQFSTPSGRINLVAVASRAEVIPSDIGLNLSIGTQGGAITAENHTQITTSGNWGGDVFIRGGRFELISSWVSSDTLGEQDGGITDIRVDNLSVSQGSGISTDTFGSGKGGDIVLEVTDALTLAGEGERLFDFGANASLSNVISASSFSAGHGGDIWLRARQLTVKDGSGIASAVYGSGKGGMVSLKVADTLEISGINRADDRHRDDWIFGGSTVSIVSGSPHQTGHSGNIVIDARRVIMSDGAYIISSTMGHGNGGTIVIKVRETLDLFGSTESTAITASSEGTGDAGNLEIEAGRLQLMDRSGISTFTGGSGNGGSIDIFVTDALTISSVKKEYHGVIDSDSGSQQSGAGIAGDISVRAGTINLNGTIGSAAANAVGGNITVITPNLLYLREGKITSSVHSGSGNGGNITIENPQFVVLNKGQITAQAYEGRGGDIHITSDQFIASPCSQVSTSSKLGIDGEVEIDAPEVNLDDFLVVLPGSFVDASSQLQSPCTVAGVARNRFVVKRFAGSPPSQGDWKSNRLVLLPPEGEPRPNQTISHGSKDPKDASAGMAHKGLAFQPPAAQESRVVDEPLF